MFLNLPGVQVNNPRWYWVPKRREDRSIGSDQFIYIDNSRPTGPLGGIFLAVLKDMRVGVHPSVNSGCSTEGGGLPPMTRNLARNCNAHRRSCDGYGVSGE